MQTTRTRDFVDTAFGRYSASWVQGCEWRDDECKLLDPREKRIQVMVRDGCPMISKEEGGKALRVLEEYYVKQELKLAVAKVMAKEGECSQREDASLLLMTWMKRIFPDLPDEVVLRTIHKLKGNAYPRWAYTHMRSECVRGSLA